MNLSFLKCSGRSRQKQESISSICPERDKEREMTQKADNLRVKRTKILLRVQRFTVVDNSDFSPPGLTVTSDSPYDKKTVPVTHFKP